MIEGPTAGGHNAPPRGPLQLDASGQPIYGPRDEVDLAKIAALGLPFWLAGGYGHPDRLRAALAAGAAGVQVGTPFAFCRESGLADEIKRPPCSRCRWGEAAILTDPVPRRRATRSRSCTAGHDRRAGGLRGAERICDLGYLRQPYKREDGSLGYRCPAEPVADYVRKGGRRRRSGASASATGCWRTSAWANGGGGAPWSRRS